MNDTSKQRNCAAHVHTHIHIHRHTCAHTHTRTHLVPRFTCGQQVSHKQWTRPVLSCWQLTRLSTPPPPKHTHRHVHPALTHKYPSHSTHTHTLAGMSWFWQADRGAAGSLHPHGCTARRPSAPSISATWNISMHILYCKPTGIQ